MRPRTQYVDSGGYSIAYQVIGDGPVDVLFLQGLLSHLDMQWCDPIFAAFLNRLASCSRLVVMDQRGVGLSDGAGTIPTIDERVADLAAVADAVGSKRMFLIGHCHGGPPAIVYTASHPERVAGLILMSTFANGTAGANHSGALSEQDFASWMEAIDHWGEGRSMSYFNPSRDEGRLYRHLYASFERAALTRGMARAAVASTREIDVTTALGSIRVPTMVMHCTDDFLPVESGKFLATSIPGARFVELDGADHAPFVGSGSRASCGRGAGIHRRSRCAGPGCARALRRHRVHRHCRLHTRGSPVRRRALGGTAHAPRHCSARRDRSSPRRMPKVHGRRLSCHVQLCEDALRCAAALQGIAGEYGFAIRCGVHAGDYETAGEDAIGLTVIIASRLMSAARAGRILVSNAVSTAVAGANFQFGSRKELTLKGVPGTTSVAELVTECDVQNTTSRWRPDPVIHGPATTWLDRLVVLGATRFPSASPRAVKDQAQRRRWARADPRR